MNSTTKYQKLRHFFFVIDFCFGPRVLWLCVTSRRFGPPTVTQSAEMSEEERERNRPFSMIWIWMMNGKWWIWMCNGHRQEAHTKHTAGPLLLLLLRSATFQRQQVNVMNNLYRVLLPLSCFVYKNWRHLPSTNQFLSLNFHLNAKMICVEFLRKNLKFGAHGGDQSEFF